MSWAIERESLTGWRVGVDHCVPSWNFTMRARSLIRMVSGTLIGGGNLWCLSGVLRTGSKKKGEKTDLRNALKRPCPCSTREHTAAGFGGGRGSRARVWRPRRRRVNIQVSEPRFAGSPNGLHHRPPEIGLVSTTQEPDIQEDIRRRAGSPRQRWMEETGRQ